MSECPLDSLMQLNPFNVSCTLSARDWISSLSIWMIFWWLVTQKQIIRSICVQFFQDHKIMVWLLTAPNTFLVWIQSISWATMWTNMVQPLYLKKLKPFWISLNPRWSREFVSLQRQMLLSHRCSLIVLYMFAYIMRLVSY